MARTRPPDSRRVPPVRKTLIAILLLVLSMPAQALAGSKVEDYLVSVGRLYDDLEYEQALGQIARARRLPLTREESIALSLYEGIILSEMSRWEEASAVFKSALSQDPAAKLPVKVSPKLERQFEAVRHEVESELPHQEPEEPPSAPQLAQQSTVPPEAQPSPLEEKSPQWVPATQTASAKGTPLQSRVLIPAVGSGVLLVAGGTAWALSRRELSRIRTNDSSLATREDIHSSASLGRTYQTLGVGLLGAGVVGLAVTTVLYMRGTSTHEAVTLGLSTDGTSAFVQGRWP